MLALIVDVDVAVGFDLDVDVDFFHDFEGKNQMIWVPCAFVNITLRVSKGTRKMSFSDK